MRTTNNRTIVDLRKVQFADFFYKSGPYKRAKLPKGPTVNGQEVVEELALFSTETMLQLATRRGLLDKWIPVCRLQLSANHSLVYTGKKAVSIFKEFSRRQFSKTNNTNK